MIEFTPEDGEPIDLSKYTPKYGGEAEEALKRKPLEGLQDFSHTFSGFFNADRVKAFGWPIGHYARCQARDDARMREMKAIERAVEGPLGFLNPQAEVRRRRNFFGSLTWAQQTEYALYRQRGTALDGVSGQRRHLN